MTRQRIGIVAGVLVFVLAVASIGWDIVMRMDQHRSLVAELARYRGAERDLDEASMRIDAAARAFNYAQEATAIERFAAISAQVLGDDALLQYRTEERAYIANRRIAISEIRANRAPSALHAQQQRIRAAVNAKIAALEARLAYF